MYSDVRSHEAGAIELPPDVLVALQRALDVKIFPFEVILTIKVSMPRPGTSSGAVGARDVYGSQQNFPLADLDIATAATFLVFSGGSSSRCYLKEE